MQDETGLRAKGKIESVRNNNNNWQREQERKRTEAYGATCEKKLIVNVHNIIMMSEREK